MPCQDRKLAAESRLGEVAAGRRSSSTSGARVPPCGARQGPSFPASEAAKKSRRVRPRSAGLSPTAELSSESVVGMSESGTVTSSSPVNIRELK